MLFYFIIFIFFIITFLFFVCGGGGGVGGLFCNLQFKLMFHCNISSRPTRRKRSSLCKEDDFVDFVDY